MPGYPMHEILLRYARSLALMRNVFRRYVIGLTLNPSRLTLSFSLDYHSSHRACTSSKGALPSR